MIEDSASTRVLVGGSRLSQYGIVDEDLYKQLQRMRSNHLETQKYRILSIRTARPHTGYLDHLGGTTDSSKPSTEVNLDDWPLMRLKWDHTSTGRYYPLAVEKGNTVRSRSMK